MLVREAVVSQEPPSGPAADAETSLGAQFRRHLPAYLFGAVVLAVFQLSMNRIDWKSKQAIDLIFSDHPGDAWWPAALMLLAVVAFVTRVASRWFMFNAGRDVEYDLRRLLLSRLHKLGAAFYRTMPAGEIMSCSSGDLMQVRLLFGFGILNVVNVVFAFASALQVNACRLPEAHARVVRGAAHLGLDDARLLARLLPSHQGHTGGLGAPQRGAPDEPRRCARR